MTNENTIIIKSQQKKWFIKGVASLLMMLFSLFLALLPLVSSVADNINLFFYIAGFSLFAGFTALFVFILYKECKPGNAIKLNAHGFIDYLNVGDNIEIEWTNVSAVKMLGKENMPFLGISLENSEIVLSKMKKNMAAEMRENIDQNLPAILIPQNTIRISVKELKSMFIKFTREAHALETDASKKTKNNPFSTEDVLRAFGQLPKEPEVHNEETTEAIDTQLAAPFEVPDEISAPEEADADHKSASDSFYEALRAKATVSVPEEVASQETQSVDNCISDEELPDGNVLTENSGEDISEDMPEDMKDLLSKAKSSKISELEKILNDTDVPYALGRSEKIDAQGITEDVTTIQASENETDASEALAIDLQKNAFKKEDTPVNMEAELEILLANALKSTDGEDKQSEEIQTTVVKDSNGDTREFILDFPNK